MSIQQGEVAVIGGGMIGAAIALGLAQNGFQIILIDRQEPPVINNKQQPDIRTSAINISSVTLLKLLGVWDTIKAIRVHPYNRLEIWEWESAHLSFDACELGLTELGFMVENNILKRILWNALDAHPAVTLFCPANLKKIYRRHNCWMLDFSDMTKLKVSMIIGADGTNSQVRQLAGISTYTWQYRQSCILITVKCESESGNNIWQHFTPTGPHAFLPLHDQWASLVWYDNLVYIRHLQNMSMAQLQKEVINRFPSRLGTVIPVASGKFSFSYCHALQYIQNGLALIGDAAHTIHPLAGQGVNLGYRDVNTLLKVMTNARNYGENWNNVDVLKRYQFRRQIDNYFMQNIINLFYAGFSNNIGLVRIMRNLGLIAAQHSGLLKRRALNYALGL